MHLTKDRPKSFKKRTKRSVSATKSSDGEHQEGSDPLPSATSPSSADDKVFLPTSMNHQIYQQNESQNATNEADCATINKEKLSAIRDGKPNNFRVQSNAASSTTALQTTAFINNQSSSQVTTAALEDTGKDDTNFSQQPISPTKPSKFNKGGFGRGSFRLPGLDELRGKTLRRSTSSTTSSTLLKKNKDKSESSSLLKESTKNDNSSEQGQSTLQRGNKKLKKSWSIDTDEDSKSGTSLKKGFLSRRGGSVRLKDNTPRGEDDDKQALGTVKRSSSTGGERGDVKSLRERLESSGSSLRNGISRLGSSVSSRTQPKRSTKKNSVQENDEKLLISEEEIDPDENTNTLVKINDDKKKNQEILQQQQELQPPKEKKRIIGGQSVARITSLKAQPSTPTYKKLDSDPNIGVDSCTSEPSSPKSPSIPQHQEPLTEFYKPISHDSFQQKNETYDDGAMVSDKEKLLTSKHKDEWSLEGKKMWERQKLKESEREYKMKYEKKKNDGGGGVRVESQTTPQTQSQQQQQHQTSQKFTKQDKLRNRENMITAGMCEKQETKATEIENIMENQNYIDNKNRDVKKISSSTTESAGMNENTTTQDVDYKKVNPSPQTPQQSNNDNPLKTRQTFANSGGLPINGVEKPVYGDSRQESSRGSDNIQNQKKSNPFHISRNGFEANDTTGDFSKNNNNLHKNEQPSYEGIQVRKSFSIKSLTTPKLGRRKLDDNGRLLDKKGCAQRNIVGSLSFFSSSKNSNNNSNKQQQAVHQDTINNKERDEEDEMQTELYESKFKQNNASKNSSSWLGKSGLLFDDSSNVNSSPSSNNQQQPQESSSPTNSRNTFKNRDGSQKKSIDNADDRSNYGNSSKTNKSERQHLLQNESDSDEDACLDRSILKSRKNKDEREKSSLANSTQKKSTASKLAGGLSFRKKYNFDKL